MSLPASCNTDPHSCVHRDAEQALTYRIRRCRAGFTSFCKNEGTDLLIFFRCSGSKNKDEEGDGMDDTKEKLIGKQSSLDCKGQKYS